MAIAAPLSFACAWFGGVVVDEGIYLYSARLVLEGRAPYKDFLFWQPPVALEFFARAAQVIGFELFQMRCVCAGLTLLSLGMLAFIARRRSGTTAVAILIAALGLNLPFMQATTVVRTQPVSIFLYVGALGILELFPRGRARLLLASATLGAAAACRLSLLPLLPLMALYSFEEEGRSAGALALSALASAGVFAAIMAPAVADAFAQARFGLWDYFGLLKQNVDWPVYLKTVLADGAVAFVLLAAASAALASREIRCGRFEVFLLASYCAVSGVHLASPVKYPVHQETNLPLLALFVACVLGRWSAGAPPRRRRAFGASLAALVFLAALVAPPDEFRLDWREGRRPLAAIERVVESLRRAVPAGSTIYAGDPTIAVEGGFRLLDGLNMGFLSHLGAYLLSTDECLRWHAVDNRILERAFDRGVPAAVLLQSWDMLMIDRDRSGITYQHVVASLKKRYRKAETFEEVGQFSQRLDLWVRK